VGGAVAPGAAEESLAGAVDRGAALEITLSCWIVEAARVAGLPGVTDDDAVSWAEDDCAPGETTFTALLRVAVSAPASGAIPARPSASGAAMAGAADGAAPCGVCAIATQPEPRIPITEKNANPRFSFPMASSRPVISSIATKS
jgi:hypothetical protein